MKPLPALESSRLGPSHLPDGDIAAPVAWVQTEALPLLLACKPESSDPLIGKSLCAASADRALACKVENAHQTPVLTTQMSFADTPTGLSA